jgi:hypothetical protein
MDFISTPVLHPVKSCFAIFKAGIRAYAVMVQMAGVEPNSDLLQVNVSFSDSTTILNMPYRH